MADNYLSGLTGAISLGTTAYAFGKWKAAFNTKTIPVNNFTSGGYQALVKGFTKATITASGPYNQGNMPLTCGNTYTFNLTLTAGTVLTATGVLGDMTMSNDAEGNPQVDITAESTGSFAASFT